MVHGGAGVDTLRLGSDVQGVPLEQRPNDLIKSVEVLDLTGSTATEALGNTAEVTAKWIADITDAGATRTFKIMGDGNDHVNLKSSEQWTLQNSDLQGYDLYQTTYNDQTLKLYLATVMADPVIG